MSKTTAPQRPSPRTGEPPARQRDLRWFAAAGLMLATFALGLLIKWAPGTGVEASGGITPPAQEGFAALPKGAGPEAVRPETTAPADAPRGPLATALQKAEQQVQQGKYDDAIRTMNQVRPIAQQSADAYRVIGRALIGRGDFATARDFLAKAIDLAPTVAETYFDHARASEGLKDLETALGGMRTFLHLVKDRDPQRLPVAQARAAIWEWESQLGRGPWGATQGVPPGFTAEQIRRDGKGTGILMQTGPQRPDGTWNFEVKSGKSFPELWRP